MAESPYRSVNPATGELLKVFDLHDDQAAFGALDRAHKAFHDHWSTLGVAERAVPIARAAALMRERRDFLARLSHPAGYKCINTVRREILPSRHLRLHVGPGAQESLKTSPDPPKTGKNWGTNRGTNPPKQGTNRGTRAVQMSRAKSSRV
jgi:succinate-semialdehyde dehydrogenase/glutarate-semialdehyde dehydrogenase